MVVACVLPLVFYMLALMIESGSGIELGGLATEELRSINEHSSALLYATIARSIGFALMAVPLFFLFRAAQARTDRMHGVLARPRRARTGDPGRAGPDHLVGPDRRRRRSSSSSHPASATSTRSPTNLREESGGLQTAAGLLLPGMLALIFSFIYAPLWAVRTGLLTRFFGTLGMALGASLLFILQVALLAVLSGSSTSG